MEAAEAEEACERVVLVVEFAVELQLTVDRAGDGARTRLDREVRAGCQPSTSSVVVVVVLIILFVGARLCRARPSLPASKTPAQSKRGVGYQTSSKAVSVILSPLSSGSMAL